MDARGWKVRHLVTLDLPAPDTLQDFTEQVDGTIIASQGVHHGGVEDAYLVKLAANGSRLGTMIARGAGHATIISTLGPDRVLFEMSGRLVDVLWRPGEVTFEDVKPWGGRFQSGPVSAVVDRKHNTAMFYNASGDAKHAGVGPKSVVLRFLKDVETQTDRVLGAAGPLTNRDRQGKLTLRQGWAVYGSQCFFLIGNAEHSQELLSYSLTNGKLQWRRAAAFCSEDWQEPEGLEVVPQVVLKGGSTENPPIDIGYTCRTYSGSSFTRHHYIKRLRDPNTWLTTDAGLYVVDPAKVSTVLLGRAGDRTVKKTRQPGDRLWIERIETRWGEPQAVTTHSTYYALEFLLKVEEW